MDADVSITHPELPLEWLFNRWGVTQRTSIALPWDVRETRGVRTISVDSRGQQVLNTGLVIVQDLPYTQEMLEAWQDCPEEKRWAGCARWKKEWSHEQRAFSEFVRYEFNPEGDNIVVCIFAFFPSVKFLHTRSKTKQCNLALILRNFVLRDWLTYLFSQAIPCDDAMSFPGMMAQYKGRIASNCNGTFFRHHTLNKERTKGSVATSIMQLLYGMMQDSVRDNKEKIWIVEDK
jgi:hypothetical protein